MIELSDKGGIGAGTSVVIAPSDWPTACSAV